MVTVNVRKDITVRTVTVNVIINGDKNVKRSVIALVMELVINKLVLVSARTEEWVIIVKKYVHLVVLDLVVPRHALIVVQMPVVTMLLECV